MDRWHSTICEKTETKIQCQILVSCHHLHPHQDAFTIVYPARWNALLNDSTFLATWFPVYQSPVSSLSLAVWCQGLCLPETLINDGYKHCDNGSDEGITMACTAPNFCCENGIHGDLQCQGRCISYQFINNGVTNCDNGSDEEGTKVFKKKLSSFCFDCFSNSQLS